MPDHTKQNTRRLATKGRKAPSKLPLRDIARLEALPPPDESEAEFAARIAKARSLLRELRGGVQ